MILRIDRMACDASICFAAHLSKKLSNLREKSMKTTRKCRKGFFFEKQKTKLLKKIFTKLRRYSWRRVAKHLNLASPCFRLAARALNDLTSMRVHVHGNRDQATSSKRGRLEYFTT